MADWHDSAIRRFNRIWRNRRRNHQAAAHSIIAPNHLMGREVRCRIL
jgi:hypothetical protein